MAETKPTPDAAEEQEVVFFEGSPNVLGEVGLVLGCFAAFVILVSMPFVIHYFRTDLLPWWGWLAFFALGIGMMAIPPLWVRRLRYRISNTRIDTREGLLTIREGTIWLWKVDDVQMTRTIVDRVLGVGSIVVIANDPTTPKMTLRSLPNPSPFFEQLKKHVDTAKRKRRVMQVEGGQLG
jgi:membrane protein YdbS with pleckstrin-like domain